jgi:alkanesulfonate monooxygenase SsuD/methylene tetrahydromethanopterin reductase-like flavin-dependent oxidoreductase (luciferase family)
MSAPITFGIQTMPDHAWTEIRDDWTRYDREGWDSLWLPDHLIPPSGAPGPFFEAWMALAALAPATARARIGILVTSNTFRHPSVLAKQAVTVDHISGGRLILGIGAGWFVAEHEAFGLEFPDTGLRVSRYAEALDLLDQFLRNDLTSFSGKYYTLQEAPNRPTPVQQPRMPIIVGAHGPRTIAIAARQADIWNSRGSVDEMRERSALLDAAATKAGRDPAEIVRSAYYISGRTESRPWDSVDAFTEWVEQYRAIGFTDFLFEEPPAGKREIASRIAADVLPALRKG